MLSVPEGETKEVYSTAYLKGSSNLWAQRYSTRELRSDITGVYDDAEEFVVVEPINITYDERTGNVIVSMSLQGALVGTPDETWKRVAVGRFAPTDFSFLGKVRLLMLSANFWLSTLAFSLSVIAVVLVVSEFFDLSHRLPSISRCLIAVMFALCGIGFSVAGFPPFGGGSPVGFVLIDTEPLWATTSLVFAVVSVAMSLPRRRIWAAAAGALAIMNAFIILSFVLWLTGGLILPIATLVSFVLTALTAFMLWRHLTRQNPYLES